MSKETNEIDENREFFRVDDRLSFDYFIQHNSDELDEQVIQERLFSVEEYRQYQLVRQLYEIDQESHRYLAEIARMQPEVSQYLSCLHQKFNLLAQTLSAKHLTDPKEINLSLGGMAFQAEADIESGSRLKIKLLFYPSGLGIVTTLKVLRSHYSPNKNALKPYQICGQFTDLSPIDEQIIHQHVMQRQILDSY